MTAAQKRLDGYMRDYGLKPINLIIERHQLSSEKRDWFAVRYVEKNPVKEKEYTEKMEEIGEKIYNLDMVLLVKYKIDKNLRTKIIRDIKKVYPNGEWMQGFVEEK